MQPMHYDIVNVYVLKTKRDILLKEEYCLQYTLYHTC